MKYRADINVMPMQEILDPQGKAVALGLKNLGISSVDDVRIGKHITLTVEAADENIAKQQVEQACSKLLANLIMEEFSFSLSPLN